MSQDRVASIVSKEVGVRVLLFDEHPVFRTGLTGFLASESKLQVVAETSSAATVMRILATEPVDVLLIDFCLGTGRGTDFIRQVRKRYPRVRVLVMTMFDEPDQLASAMRAGAHGSITKTQSPRNWVQMICQVVPAQNRFAVAR